MDGRSNWEEYAFGTNPLVSDVHIQPIQILQNSLRVEFNRRIEPLDLNYTLEILIGEEWAEFSKSFFLAPIGNDGQEMERQVVELGPDIKQVFRLRVTSSENQ